MTGTRAGARVPFSFFFDGYISADHETDFDGGSVIFMTVDRRGRGTFPEQVRRELGIGTEDTHLILLSKTERGTYELVPATLIPKDQIWFHHPEMQSRIAEAEADFRERRFTRTETPDEAQAYLDRLKG
jgi:bifunctional DNA-binding transcriptional regulator/antitoxin component of YhaV-PrlF toxin-antitoxin module